MIGIELIATFTGLAGAWYVAEEGQRATWGFALFLSSNIGWGVYGASKQDWLLVALQVGFTVLSLRGIWKKHRAKS